MTKIALFLCKRLFLQEFGVLVRDAAGEVHERRVHQGGHDKDAVPEHENLDNRIPGEYARKSEQDAKSKPES